MFSRRLPKVRSCVTVTGRLPTRQTFLPSVWISRCSSSSSSHVMPKSSPTSGGMPVKQALT